MTLARWLGRRFGIPARRQHQLARAMQLTLLAVVAFGLGTLRLGLALTGALPLAVSLVPEYLRRDHDVPLDVGWSLWVTTAVLIHAVGSLGAYGWVGWYDQLAHVVSAALVAACGYAVTRAAAIESRGVYLPEPFLAVFVVLSVVALGVGWELMEYGTDLLAGAVGAKAVLVIRGVDDVALDLLANAIGAVVVGLWGARPIRRVAAALSRKFAERF